MTFSGGPPNSGRVATQAGGLENLRVVSFESRRASEMAELIRRYGGEPIVAPSMREVPLGENAQALDFVRRLEAGEIDVVILLTGVGTRTLVEAVAREFPPERLARALGKAALVARGPKPIAALKELGLQPTLSVPEPNTWRELLRELDASLPVSGKRVAVQEYGVKNDDLIAGLQGRGAIVLRVTIYRWALPEDTGPLEDAIERIIAGGADIALFTNATQVEHVLRLAAERGREAELLAGLSNVVIGSIGPVCTEALEGRGLKPDLEPDHPKMGHLVAALARRAPLLVRQKREKRATAS